MRSAIILAGGNSSRFGEEKAFHPFRGKALIEHVYGRVSPACGEVLVVVRDEKEIPKYADLLNCRVVADLEPRRGPLMGMYTGLLSATGEESTIVGADMPFLNPQVIEFLFGQIEGFDAVVPTIDKERVEPLLSVYRTKQATLACEKSLALGKKRMVSALDFLRARYIPVAELKAIDPGLESLININSKEDLDAAVREKGKD